MSDDEVYDAVTEVVWRPISPVFMWIYRQLVKIGLA